MDDEDLGGTTATMAGSDDGYGGSTTIKLPYRAAPRVAATAPSEAGFETGETEGDTLGGSTGSETGIEGEALHEEVGSLGEATESGEEADTAEASVEQLAVGETGEESAEADLESMEGFERATPAGEGAGEALETLPEAGAAIEGDTESGAAEFAFLAGLVPTLLTTFGPPLARAVIGRLSPKVRRRVMRMGRLAAPALGAAGKIGARSPLSGMNAVLRALIQAANRPGGETGAEVDEALAAETAAQMELIIGRDDRVRIRPTARAPWQRLCALRITFPSGRTYRGTGFLIGARAVATAGHCVYLHSEGGWAREVEVIPAMDGATRPFGSVKSSNLRSVKGWVTSRKPESDYGCVMLPAGAFGGRDLGRFGFAALDAAAIVARPAVLAGYPGDKPFAELWGMVRRVKSVRAKTLVYDIDTMGGQSGAPVYIKRGGRRCVVGIHNYGAASGNSATRVTKRVYARLKAWSQFA